ncbi:MAG: YqaJ viral recombinase family protein, partial [Aeromicrobium sp.]|nr:YqaJ viral recombinase family protein [Burkholderiales bacterium]
FAANLYTVETGLLVESVGFRRHRTIPFVGASADGLVGTNGGIEIKSPFNSGVHKRTWLNGMPAEHMPQVQGVMWVLELDWLDFISFDPRMPDDLRLYVQRIVRDDDYIENLKSKVTAFLSDVQADMDKPLSVPPNRLNLVIDSAAAVVPSSWELVADDAPAAVPKKRGKAVISPDNTLRNHAAIFAMFD